MLRGDHARTWQLGIHGQRLTVETDQVGNEQEQAANPGDELAWHERKLANIGDGLLGGPDRGEALFVQPLGKVAKPSSRRISRTAVAPSGVPSSLSVRLMS